MRVVIGWDVGGAHLKVARAEDGCIVDAVQVASPLRLGLERLAQAFIDAKARIGSGNLHVVTMTGELADTFASLAARAVRTALLVDIGSTTTDLVPIVTGSVAARGYTDAERLAAGELVYTGMVRSFAMAVAERAPFAGRWSPLINENFATMADVHRILGQLPDGVDQMATPDGRAKSIEASRARLARMIGCDMDDASGTAWSMLARWFAEGQIRAIIDGAM